MSRVGPARLRITGGAGTVQLAAGLRFTGRTFAVTFDGPFQGAQYINVYSDYNNGDHANGNYIEVFITEYMLDPPNTALYGEVIRALTPLNSPEFFANVDLVE